METLPSTYAWLADEPAPASLKEALRHYGVMEHPGKGSDPDITAWAKEVGVSGWYTDDDIPWCGLFVGICVKRAGYPFSANRLLAAKEWATYGAAVKGPALLWDILVFVRPGGGHVGFCVGQTKDAYLVYGGNQSNKVGFAWLEKSRCIAIRRPAYKIGVPPNVRYIGLTATGTLSTNEA